jgi:hypothetical protein
MPKTFQSICKLFSYIELLHQETLSGFMTALLARNVVRPFIIMERSVPMVLQIKHSELLHSLTSSVGSQTVTGLTVRTHRARDPTVTGLSLVFSVVQLGFWRPGRVIIMASPTTNYEFKTRLSFPEFAFICFNSL